MTITVYSSLDTGAPALPSTAGQRFFDNLRLILLACLVNGYGSKPAAGWTLVQDHADGFTLSNGEGFINIVNVSNSTVAIYLMETVTDGSAALAVGDNRRSGPWYEAQSVSGRQYLYTPYFSGTQTNKHWAVVADGRTATLQFYSYTAAVDTTTSFSGAFHFGAYRPAFGGSGFCALGGNVTSNGYPVMASPSGVTAGTVLRNPFTGAVDQGVSPGYRVGVAMETVNAGLYAKVQLAPTILRPVRASIMARGVGVSGSTSGNADANCGLLRGLIAEPALTDARLSKVLPFLGIATPVYQDKLRPLTLPNGKQWVPLFYDTADLEAFISLDPADWE